MSRIYYEFATPTQTSWLHEIACDACRRTVTREGSVPRKELDPIGAWPGEGGLSGWGTFEVGSYSATLKPRLSRDLCPECSLVFNDLFLTHGVGLRESETRYLDALGRQAQEAYKAQEHLRFCVSPIPSTPTTWCLLLAGHSDAHSLVMAAGYHACPVCLDGMDRVGWDLSAYTFQELESHAVSIHRVRFEPGRGWWSEAESLERNLTAHVYYAECLTALYAESNVERRRRERSAHYFGAEDGLP